MPDLLVHIEQYLGKVQRGWQADSEGRDLPFQLIQCSTKNFLGVDSYATLGLSNYPLHSRESDKEIFLELVLMFKSRTVEHQQEALSHLSQLSLEIISTKCALLRGDVVSKPGTLFSGSQLTSLYVTMPSYLPDQFSVARTCCGKNVTFAWLVPIGMYEKNTIQEAGWEHFEDSLEYKDPDLFDLTRKEIFV